MALSGSIDLSYTATQIITFALRKINSVALGQSPSSEDADAALMELELMLKNWQKFPSIWRRSQQSISLVNATASYTPSPRPNRIISVRYRNTSSIDLPMNEMTQDEYYDLPSKSSAGTPTSWYFEPSQSGTTLYVWPVQATVTTETFRVTYQRFLDDVDALSNNVDITPEHFDTVGYNLAARLADNKGKSGPHIDRVIARAQQLYQEMEDTDRPEFVRFCADMRYG